MQDLKDLQKLGDGTDKMAVRLMILGWLAERHWDEMRESLSPEVRHTLGGEVAKIRLLRIILEREETPANGHA